MSLKGGVGKTTCAVNLAYSYAKRGWNTLLVDGDPQGSVGFSLSPSATSQRGLYEMVTERLPLAETQLKTKLETLKIVMTGQIPPGEISRWCSSLSDGQTLTPVFASAAEADFDLVVFDTPSGLHGPTEGVLRNVSHVLVPQQAEPLALRSLMMTVDFLSELQSHNRDGCTLLGVVLTMVDQTRPESLAVAQEIRQLLPSELVLHTVLPRDGTIVEASMIGMPLGMMRAAAPPMSSLLFDQLAAEVETKLGAVPIQANEYVSLVV